MRTDDLGALPIKALMARSPGVDWAAVDDVLFGWANQAGEDKRNVARQAALHGLTLRSQLAALRVVKPREHATDALTALAVSRTARAVRREHHLQRRRDVTPSPAPRMRGAGPADTAIVVANQGPGRIDD